MQCQEFDPGNALCGVDPRPQEISVQDPNLSTEDWETPFWCSSNQRACNQCRRTLCLGDSIDCLRAMKSCRRQSPVWAHPSRVLGRILASMDLVAREYLSIHCMISSLKTCMPGHSSPIHSASIIVYSSINCTAEIVLPTGWIFE
jgi:hypothetical protein